MAANLRLLLIPLLLSALLTSSLAGNIAVYWGQNTAEGSLADACSTGNYAFVIIAFLTTFGNGQTPVLNLAGHCDPASNTCTTLTADVQSCQSQGVKVFLSLGGGAGAYGLSSSADAQSVAAYLWDNFLGGSGGNRPLGAAVLDGIDFDIELGPPDNWDELARSLSQYGQQAGRKVYLSAAPQCVYPDAHLSTAIAAGVFDYVWVQFYNNPGCEYSSGSVGGLSAAWSQWTSAVSGGSVYLGLPSASDAAGSGYVAPDVVTSQVLPVVQGSGNYGGIMLWNRYYDGVNGFSNAVKGSV